MPNVLNVKDKNMKQNRYDDFGAVENGDKPRNNITVEKKDDKFEINENSNLIGKGLTPLAITVEPILFLISFAQSITSNISIDMIERSVCLQYYNMSIAECTNSLSQVKSSAEGLSAQVVLIKNLLQGLVPCILAVLVGPWSDKNGRKPFTSFAIQGYAIFYLAWALMSFFPSIPAMYLVIPSLSVSLTGGMAVIQVCTTCYVCDVFSDHQRTYRLAAINGGLTFGQVIGNLMAATVDSRMPFLGYPIIYFTSFFIMVITYLYTSYCLKETVNKNEMERTKLFKWINIKNIFTALFSEPRKGLMTAILVVTTLAMEIIMTHGDRSIMYLVTKSQYNWTLEDFCIFSAVCFAITGTMPFVMLWLFRDLLRVGPWFLIMVSALIMFAMQLTKAIADNDIVFITAQCIVATLAEFIAPIIDTDLYSIVSPDDVGKASSVVLLIQSTSPVIFQAFSTELYRFLLPLRKTLYVFFLSAGFAAVITVSSILLWLKSTDIPR